MLGHIADVALDLVGLGADVQTQALTVPLVGREQPGQHADGRGLAGTVGSEKAVDLAALDLHGEIAHDRAAIEAFGEAFDVDGDFRRLVHREASCGSVDTLTG